MYRIHPADNRCQYLAAARGAEEEEEGGGRPWVLTVWKRSSMSFQGTDGFTVFDRHGRLAFRVDNYTRNRCCAGGLVLMDGAGNPLLTLKPQILSMQCQWNGYRGEEKDQCESKSPKSRIFAMRRRSALVHATPCEAEVFMGGHKEERPTPDFRMEGSFRRRSCKIRTATGQLVANIARKTVNKTVVLGDDVFSLVVQPGFDPELVMAFVVILDRICHKPFTPVLCS